MTLSEEKLQQILEAVFVVADAPLSLENLLPLFSEEEQVTLNDLRDALISLEKLYEQRPLELKKVASGYRLQSRSEYAQWIARLWEEKPAKYSRATLETLVLIAYRQPVTRADIEQVRGVAVSSHIIQSLIEREWVRVVGHRDVPGKPALLATTKKFLDYFNLASLDELPTLQDIQDLDEVEKQLQLELEQPEKNIPFETSQPDEPMRLIAAVENNEITSETEIDE